MPKLFKVYTGLTLDASSLPFVKVVVHHTSFGVVNPRCGYDKFRVLATVEAKEKSQILLCGCSKHFDVMLGLFLEQYSCIRKEELLIVSDEDKAFL